MDKFYTNIKERVLYFAKYKGVSIEKFLDSIGMTYGSFKGKAKEGALNSTAIEEIYTKYSDINLIWLITGKGEMIIDEKNYENNSSSLILNEEDLSYATRSDDYWRGRYDQLKEDHVRLLKELSDIKSANAS